MYDLVHQNFWFCLMALVEQHSSGRAINSLALPINQFSPCISQNRPVDMFLLEVGCSAPQWHFQCGRKTKNTAVLQLIRPLFTLFTSFMLKTHTREAGITSRSSQYQLFKPCVCSQGSSTVCQSGAHRTMGNWTPVWSPYTASGLCLGWLPYPLCACMCV